MTGAGERVAVDLAPQAVVLSVIMPVYNGATTLRLSLAPLLRMQRDGEIAEILLVDDGSTDGTRALAADLGVRVIDSGGRLGPGGARNVAAPIASGDVVWFVDADVVVHDDAARVLAEAFERTAVVAVFGTYDDKPPAPNFLSQYKNLVHHHYHRREAGAAETFWAGCGAVRKSRFLELGGFDMLRYRRPSIEDIEFGLRLRQLGHAIRLEPRLQGTHLKEWRLRNLLHTEIFCRALPWSRLIHANPGWRGTLNARPSERLRALLALGLLASLPLAAFAPSARLLPLLLLVGVLAANGPLLALLYRRHGALFAVGGVLFHQVYYLYSAAAFGWCWIEHLWALVRARLQRPRIPAN